jgi:RimK family alpha-L-glutamate ligase
MLEAKGGSGVHEVALLGGRANATTLRLVDSWRRLGVDARLVTGPELASLGQGDVAIGRLDVLPGLDGVEPGLFDLLVLERRGIVVKNSAIAVLAAHDKLRTARSLAAAGVPQPRTTWVRSADDPIEIDAPLVVKPRFGSWGKDVHRCASASEARALLRSLSTRSWFRRHGAIVQELVPPTGRDLRVLVAGGRVIGAVERAAAEGEWRTNVALGGTKNRVEIGPNVEGLALATMRALGCDLAAVDLVPTPHHGFVVLEANAAADFDDAYVGPERDADAEVAHALGLPAMPSSGAGVSPGRVGTAI